MFERIKKIGSFFRYFILARKKAWRSPRKSDVLIFDAAGQEILLEYLRPWKPEVLHVRGEQVNLPVLFSSIFGSGRKFDAYVDCFIEKVHPRLIVTYIQNSFNFYLIGKRHPGVKTLFIQNGWQSHYNDVIEVLEKKKMPRDRLEVTHMMTFGASSGALYLRYLRGANVPMGSLKNNLAPKRETKIAGTIAFVSQYRDIAGLVIDGKYYSQEAYFTAPDKLVLQFLVRYAKEHGKELLIIPCSSYLGEAMLDKEMCYYNELLGQTCMFSTGRKPFAGYDATDAAEVVVAIESALGYESAARGNKTAFFSIRTRLLGVVGLTFGWPESYPDEGPFWTNQPDPFAFERILDHLFAIDDEQWKAELSEHGSANLMAYDPGNRILQSVLNSELGALPQMGNRS